MLQYDIGVSELYEVLKYPGKWYYISIQRYNKFSYNKFREISMVCNSFICYVIIG